MNKLSYYFNFKFSLLLIILFNTLLISSIPLSLFDQSLNLLLSIGIYEYFKSNKLNYKKKSKLDIFLSIFLLIFALYRSYLTYSLDDNFIYFVLTLLMISLLIINYSLKHLFLNFKALLIASIFPLKEFFFIPLSILLTPITTAGTWFLLNIFGFNAYTKGQEIFISNRGVDITFGCSGSEQIIFIIASMIVLNFLVPFRNSNIFYMHILISCVLTFFINVLRISILTIFAHTYQSVDFSIFDFLHGPRGSLVFTFVSTLLSCEIYKKLYSLEKLNF